MKKLRKKNDMHLALGLVLAYFSGILWCHFLWWENAYIALTGWQNIYFFIVPLSVIALAVSGIVYLTVAKRIHKCRKEPTIMTIKFSRCGHEADLDHYRSTLCDCGARLLAWRLDHQAALGMVDVEITDVEDFKKRLRETHAFAFSSWV